MTTVPKTDFAFFQYYINNDTRLTEHGAKQNIPKGVPLRVYLGVLGNNGVTTNQITILAESKHYNPAMHLDDKLGKCIFKGDAKKAWEVFEQYKRFLL